MQCHGKAKGVGNQFGAWRYSDQIVIVYKPIFISLTMPVASPEEFDQILSLISNPCYWWRKTKRTHFTSLTTLLNDGSLCVKDVAIITRGLTQLVVGLHSRELVQSNLESRDAYLRKRGVSQISRTLAKTHYVVCIHR